MSFWNILGIKDQMHQSVLTYNVWLSHPSKWLSNISLV